MVRQEANLKIAEILKSTIWESEYGFASLLEEYAKKYPQQRTGQIICNYICDDYRSGNPAAETETFLDWLFPGNPDPFFEESVITLERLKKIMKN